TVTAVVAILSSATALRSTRPGGRASLRRVPSTAASNRRQPSTPQRAGARRVGVSAKNNQRRRRRALGRPRGKADARLRLLRSGSTHEPARVVPLRVTGRQPSEASTERAAPSAPPAATQEGRLEFGFER